MCYMREECITQVFALTEEEWESCKIMCSWLWLRNEKEVVRFGVRLNMFLLCPQVRAGRRSLCGRKPVNWRSLVDATEWRQGAVPGGLGHPTPELYRENWGSPTPELYRESWGCPPQNCTGKTGALFPGTRPPLAALLTSSEGETG